MHNTKSLELTTYLAGMGERHEGLLSPEEVDRLSAMTLCGAGAGGVAGWTYEALARAGCRRFRVADPETYEASNANRQTGCDFHTIGRNKAEVTAERLRRIRPDAEIIVYPEGVTETNLSAFLDGGTVVLDGIDLACLPMKKRLFDAALRRGLPVVSCPILAFGSALAFFHPERSPGFEAFFGPLPPEGDAAARRRFVEALAPAFFSFRPRLNWPLFRARVQAGKVPSIAMATMISGALAATAIIAYVCGRSLPACVPTTLHVDFMEGRISRTGPLRRWALRKVMTAFFRRLPQAMSAPPRSA